MFYIYIYEHLIIHDTTRYNAYTQIRLSWRLEIFSNTCLTYNMKTFVLCVLGLALVCKYSTIPFQLSYMVWFLGFNKQLQEMVWFFAPNHKIRFYEMVHSCTYLCNLVIISWCTKVWPFHLNKLKSSSSSFFASLVEIGPVDQWMKIFKFSLFCSYLTLKKNAWPFIE